jgi:NAD(P)-dependent dehydrogenase (short-subunit alcohol dehydrogenase family)
VLEEAVPLAADQEPTRQGGGKALGALEGRIMIITGAGRGLGREHALLCAAEGAKVVVNDLGSSLDGSGRDVMPAQQVADEIKAGGGEAVANTDDVSDWEGARRLVDQAIATFGDLHVLVNNAGILRDRMLVNMTEQEWDDVVKVHLKGHFCPTRWAAAHWRERAKAGDHVNAAIVNTSSGSGLHGNAGQANYAAAKAGIAAMSVVAARELGRYGVRVNAIAPLARTRLMATVAGMGERIEQPDEVGEFDAWGPGNVSPLVAYLATADCPFTGQVFGAYGGKVGLYEGWTVTKRAEKDQRWEIGELRAAMKDFPPGPPEFEVF